MGATLFRGATQLRGWLLGYLQTNMPLITTQARADWGLNAYQLPIPQSYDVYDLPMTQPNRYPAIGADFPTETNHVRTDFTDRAEPEYWSNQTGSVYVWVSTPRTADDLLEGPDTRATCMRVRDDVTELVRQLLLGTPSLGQGPDTCWLEETALNVNKMEPMRAGENRADWLSGSLISVVYRVKSELSFPILGHANTIDFTAQKLEDAP